MENMDNTTERLEIVRKMIEVAQRDAPWVWGYYPVAFGLTHGWVGNVKPNSMANNTLKYLSIDEKKRAEKREEWNRPRLWPLILFIALVVIASLPAALTVVRKLRGTEKR